MMTKVNTAAVVLAGILAVVSAVPAAQASGGFWFRLGAMSMTAQDSFEAVYDSGLGSLGVGGTVFFAHDSLALEFGADFSSKTGKRVEVAGDEVIETDIDQTLVYVPVTVTFKYRFRAGSFFVPYVGGGLGAYYISEEADDDSIDSSSSTNAGAHLCAGFELFGDRVFSWGFEARYSTVPDAIGESGTSAYYDETDAGGLALMMSGTIHFGG